MGMVINEIIPMCHALGLGRPPQRIGVMGISMGGYGALLIAEKHPDLIAAVAAISPAIWTRYSQARSANPRAYSSADDFGANDVIAHASALANASARVTSGDRDPFRSGVEALAKALPPAAVMDISRGCHTDPFFSAQQPASLRFLADHLVASPAR